MKRSRAPQFTKVISPDLEALIGHVPSDREEIYFWLTDAASKLQPRLSRREILELLRAAVASDGRYVTDSEISDAIESSHRSARGLFPVTIYKSPKAFHVFDSSAARRIIKATASPMARLQANTTDFGVPLDERKIASHIIQLLFPDCPQICAGESPESMQSRPVKEWGTELSLAPYIDPWPMTGQPGAGKEGCVKSCHFPNTGLRRFLVLEFKQFSIDEQAAILIHLADGYPLALVVDSARGSLNGWFFVAGHPEDEVEDFLGYAVNLGADRRTWTRGQAVCTPFALRRDGDEACVQTVPYFNPDYAIL